MDSAVSARGAGGAAIVLVMPGVAGLGQRVLAGSQAPDASSMAASLDALGLQVNPENVLKIRAALMGEAERLDGLLRRHQPMLWVRPPAQDPVSEPSAELLNDKIGGLANQFDAYVSALKAAGAALAKTAQVYGYTEQQIKDSFVPGKQEPPLERMPR